MNETLIVLFGIVITPWKVVGYLGVFLFASRWGGTGYILLKKRKAYFPPGFLAIEPNRKLLTVILLYLWEKRLGWNTVQHFPRQHSPLQSLFGYQAQGKRKPVLVKSRPGKGSLEFSRFQY